ncbi:MAG: HAMP domain-containing histidine kinase [Actinobacteria bacterium]|nr:HAMP domain-containing histidine kinase [Actinomycetota bacterium]MBV8396000.1 HAMP domain-containing histidine kinase [Actinomycetota bacterium]
MFSSLRVRLPLIFLGGILVAALVTTAIAIQLFGSLAHDQTETDLRREADGIAQLYSSAINQDFNTSFKNQSRRAPTFAGKSLERATNTRIYWDGPVSPFPGEKSGLRPLNLSRIQWTSGKTLSFEFTPPSLHATYLAVANPVFLGKRPIGAIVVAKQKTDVSHSVLALVKRLALAGAFGLVVAGILGWYLSWRVVTPVVKLADAADEVAGGNYAVELSARGAGEIGHLSERFGEMTARLAEAEVRERNFLMSVSHELRTPLTAIRGHISALREGVVEDSAQREQSLEIVEAEAQRLERLVGDILDLAKLDAHRFTVMHEEVDMEQLLTRAYETFTEEARRRSIDYRVEVSARPVIVSDGDRVLQIVDNLLSNAFHATPDGGRISLALAQTNGTITVSVEDTGPGIPAEKRDRLFRPFVSEGAGGTGLGLTIAKELSAALGGRIGLESEVGRGSRFELVLPAA